MDRGRVFWIMCIVLVGGVGILSAQITNNVEMGRKNVSESGENKENLINVRNVTKDAPNLGKGFENAWKNAFKAGVKMMMPMVMNYTNSDTGISGNCIRALLKYVGALTNAKMWAAKMIDATSKPMAGLFEGTYSDFGAFDECLSISVPLRNGSEEFRGSFCPIEATPLMPPRPKNFSMATNIRAGPHDTLAKELQLAGGVFYYMKFRVGVCVPSSCSVEDIRSIASQITKAVKMEVVVPTCYQRQDHIEFRAIHIVVICIVISLLILAILGTRIEFLKQADNIQVHGKSLSTRENILLAFSLRSNWKKLFSQSKGSGELRALHGIRGLSLAWVILGHTYVWTNFQLLRRPSNLQEWFAHIDFEAILNAWLSVEPFFLLSGLLTCYGCMQLMEKTKGQIHIPFFIIRRYIRLLPTLLMVMGLVFFLPLISSGPFWYERIDVELESCRNNWWTSVLFISNWTSMKSICIHPSWFLSADFQLHILSLVILYPLYRSSKLGAVAISIAIVASNLTVGILTYLFQLPPAIQISSGNDDQITETVDKIHMRTFTHVGPYMVGMATGYILLKYKDVKLSRRVRIFGWILSIVISLSSLYGVHRWNSGNPHGAFITSLYAAVHRTTFSIGVAWVAYACITGHGGAVNKFLSMSILAPLSRLTFAIYLVQSLVIWTRRASDRERMYYSHYNHLYEYMGSVIISIILAVPLHLLVEAPVSNLDRLMFTRKPRQKQTAHDETDDKVSHATGNTTNNLTDSSNEKTNPTNGVSNVENDISNATNVFSNTTNRTNGFSNSGFEYPVLTNGIFKLSNSQNRDLIYANNCVELKSVKSVTD